MPAIGSTRYSGIAQWMVLGNEDGDLAIRLAFIDSQRLLRDGLRLLFEPQSDVMLVGEGAGVRELVAVVERAHPDVLVGDLWSHGGDGMAVVRDARRRRPQCRVLGLDVDPDERRAAESLVAGASGYATKRQRGLELVGAVRTVARGDVYLTPELSRHAVDELRRGLAAGKRQGPLAELSPREQQVFALVVRGMSNQEIARELGISIKTVETHRSHINRKLDVHSPAELVRVAAERGLIPGRTRRS